MKNTNRALELLEQAAHKRALFIGETIRDTYHYVRPLGRPTKEAIVAVEQVDTEVFTGGVVAAADHAKSLCSVDVYSTGAIIEKVRYVEESHVRKLFEVYRKDGEAAQTTMPSMRPYDAVVVTDYGHGMIDKDFIERLSCARYLAVNVQTNSGNYGYNLAHKYHCADYLVVDEPEARLATQNRSGPIEDSLYALGRIARKCVVTMGKHGALGLQDNQLYACKAFTDRVVDTMGAGDAFFAITALVAEEAYMDEILRIGNAAGALKTSIVGHKRAINKDELYRLLAC